MISYKPKVGHAIGVAAFLVVPVAVHVNKGVTVIFFAGALFALAFHFLKHKALPKLNLPLCLLFGGLVAWGLVSVLWSISQADSLRLIIPLGLIFLAGVAFIAVAEKLTEEDKNIIEFGLLTGYGFGLLLILIDILTDLKLTYEIRSIYYLSKGVTVTDYPQWVANLPPAGYYNFFKNGANLAAIFLWPALVVTGRRKGIFAIAMFGITLLIFFAAKLNAPLFALLAGGIAFGLVYWLPNHAKFTLSALTVAGLIIFFIAIRLSPPVTELESRNLNLPTAVYPRVFIWQSSRKYISEKPILGRGLNSSRAISSPEDMIRTYSKEGVFKRALLPIPLHPHNIFLQVWLELGIVGLFLLFSLIFTLISTIANLPMKIFVRACCAGAMFSSLAISGVSYGIWQNWWLGTLWLVAVITVGVASNSSAISRRV
jgi:exopolysaccharide production protein ExoQ